MILLRILLLTVLGFVPVSGVWALVSDDFNPATAAGQNAVWRFYDPYDVTANEDVGESSIEYDGNNAIISIPAGLDHDLWLSSDNKAPRLLQPAANADFGIEEKIETVPRFQTQAEGIIVQENNNVFLRFGIIENGGERPQLYVAYVNGQTNDKTVFLSKTLPETNDDQYRNFPRYRRVYRAGNSWAFYYSYDRVNWTLGVSFVQAMTVTEVGVFGATIGNNPGLTSSVDYLITLPDTVNDVDQWIAPAPEINVWYDYTPAFGTRGIQQKWANIIGSVFSDTDISTLAYRLNGGSKKKISFGPDTEYAIRKNGRLQMTGDFNIEINKNLLNRGANKVEIIATDSNGSKSKKVLKLRYSKRKKPSLPYEANWQNAIDPTSGQVDVKYIEKVAHVVDGHWDITPEGARVVEKGYDRAIAIGDWAWQPNYEVTVPFTLHTPFNGIGFAVGWRGHKGKLSPRIEWPLEALAWVRGPLSNPTVEIITYGGLVGWEVVRAVQPVSIQIGNTYFLKGRTEIVSKSTSRFSVKIWQQGQAEPPGWNLVAEIPKRKGSVLLVALKTEATFGNVTINPLP